MKDDDDNKSPDRDPMASMAEIFGSALTKMHEAEKLVVLTQIGVYEHAQEEGAEPATLFGRPPGKKVLSRHEPRRRVITARALTNFEQFEEGTVIRAGFGGEDFLVSESIEEIQVKGSLSIS